jgi:hypothetical protein
MVPKQKGRQEEEEAQEAEKNEILNIISQLELPQSIRAKHTSNDTKLMV